MAAQTPLDPTLAAKVAALCDTYLRATTVTGYPGATRTLVFTPELSAAEQATYDDLVRFAKFGISTTLTLAEFQALKPQLAEIRSFRTRTAAQWNALTTAQREADEVQFLNDLTDVLRALLRDS